MTMASLPHRLEREPGAEGEARLDRDAVERDLQVGARQADPIDAAGHDGPFLAKGLADGLPIGLGQSRVRHHHGQHGREACDTHLALLVAPAIDTA